jgi:hypothetical protein
LSRERIKELLAPFGVCYRSRLWIGRLPSDVTLLDAWRRAPDEYRDEVRDIVDGIEDPIWPRGMGAHAPEHCDDETTLRAQWLAALMELHRQGTVDDDLPDLGVHPFFDLLHGRPSPLAPLALHPADAWTLRGLGVDHSGEGA